MGIRIPKFNLAIVSLLLFLSCLVSCGVREKEVSGTYFVELSFGSQRLELNPDGHYKQVVDITKTKETIIREGTWKFSSQEGIVWLENGLEFVTHTGDLNPDYANPARNNVFFSLSRTHWLWGEVELWNPHYLMHKILRDDAN